GAAQVLEERIGEDGHDGRMLAADRRIGQADIVVGAAADRDALAREAHVECRAVGEIQDELAHRSRYFAAFFLFARNRCAQPDDGRNSGGTRTSTTEILSRPPFWFAISISSAAASARSPRFSVTTLWMISGSTMSVSPSELSK